MIRAKHASGGDTFAPLEVGLFLPAIVLLATIAALRVRLHDLWASFRKAA
jgi:hypothetical protein